MNHDSSDVLDVREPTRAPSPATRRRSSSSSPTLAIPSRRSTRRSRPPRLLCGPPFQGAGAVHARREQVRAHGGRGARTGGLARPHAPTNASAASRGDRRLVAGDWHAGCAALDRCWRLSARRRRAAGRAPHGLLPRRRAEPAQPRFARAAALGRVRAGLLLRARHARVRPRGNEPVSRRPKRRAARARAEPRTAGRYMPSPT